MALTIPMPNEQDTHEMLSNRYRRIPLSEVSVPRERRQRREIDPERDGLQASIARVGVINPIIIKRDGELVAGERRLAGSLALGLPDIPARYVEDLSDIELQIIEFEENLKRLDLPWRDMVRSTARIHLLYEDLDPKWTQVRTAEALSTTPGFLSMTLRVARDLDSPRLSGAESLRAAYNILQRQDERASAGIMSEILEAGEALFAPATEGGEAGDSCVEGPQPPVGSFDGPPGTSPIPTGQTASYPGQTPAIRPVAPLDIMVADFIQWASSYTGQPFNFIHCDFPYGINAFGGPMAGGGGWTSESTPYNDSPDVYWALIKCLCGNLDRVMAHSAHLMFWFSMQHYGETLEAFRELAPSLEFNVFPLVWGKSDNAGVLPDAKRGPRRVYETCLIASREDRPIVKPVSNAYWAPTDKAHHPSTKPEPVLRHFMTMFVDEHTRMLDPTCGSGSALRAAESLGAKQVLGLELNTEHAENATHALRMFRNKQRGSAELARVAGAA